MPKRSDVEMELSRWQELGSDAAGILEEIANTRVSQTMTEHRAAEIVAENNATLRQLAARIRERLSG